MRTRREVWHHIAPDGGWFTIGIICVPYLMLLWAVATKPIALQWYSWLALPLPLLLPILFLEGWFRRNLDPETGEFDDWAVGGEDFVWLLLYFVGLLLNAPLFWEAVKGHYPH